MVHLPSLITSFKIAWIKRIQDQNISTWKNIPKYIYEDICPGDAFLNFNCTEYDIKLYLREAQKSNALTHFYLNCLISWYTLKSPQTLENILNPQKQVIWLNNCIKYKQKNLHFTDWIRNGFVYISDIFPLTSATGPSDSFCKWIKYHRN